jgi:mannose-6-phosphate isomerase-like protein (cupin superfamily)
MGQGLLVRPSKVKPFATTERYISRMLLDDKNSPSKKTHINHGILKKGAKLEYASHPGYEETYVILKGRCSLKIDGELMDIQQGDVVYIPADIKHALDNSQGMEDLELLTIWPGTPEKGVNAVYDKRIEQWGRSYVTIEEG